MGDRMREGGGVKTQHNFRLLLLVAVLYTWIGVTCMRVCNFREGGILWVNG